MSFLQIDIITVTDTMQLTQELVHDFWSRNFAINTEKLPRDQCIKEHVVLTKFSQIYPDIDTAAPFLHTFYNYTYSINLGIRRFKANNAEGAFYYNAKLLCPPSTNKSVDLALLNARGLLSDKGNKSQHISDFININNNEHILAITESHLTDQHGDAEVLDKFKKYTLHRADRDLTIGRKTKMGGVCLLTSPGILSTKELKYSNGCCELSIVNLSELNIKVITVYRPPDTLLDEFDEIIEKIKQHLDTSTVETTILLGDFNFPMDIVNWENTDDGVIPIPTNYRSSHVKEQFQNLLHLTDRFFLHQLVSEPTHDENTLDLIFTDAPHLFHSPEIMDLGVSDHRLVRFNTDIGVTSSVSGDKKYDAPPISNFNFNRANVDALKQELKNANLTEIVNNATSTHEATRQWTNKIVECATAAGVPNKDLPKTSRGPPKVVKKLFKKRTRITASLRKPGLTELEQQERHQKILEINLSIKQFYSESQKQEEAKAVNNIKTNPKAFYKYANKTRKIKTTIGPLKSTDASGVITYESGPKKMAEILSKQYQSVFSEPLENTGESDTTTTAILNDIPFLRDEVLHAIKSIDSSSAPGPDGITPKFLKTYSEELADSLCALGKRSLESGEPLYEYYLAYITPIFKSGDKSEAVNYRPVSLTSHITKIFERIIKKHITQHLADNQLYNETQHGFRKSRSTITNLIEYYESVLLQLENSKFVDSIYLDFSKAFDKCDHGIIIQKLTKLGIQGNLLRWIECFLRRRKQCVVIDGHKSETVWVISGVPQGSVLGPLLFLVLIYDITNGINYSILSSFADDTKLWKGIKINQECQLLQSDLNQIYEWTILNNMELNGKKFQAIRLMDLLNPSMYLDSNGQPIQNTTTVRDLGIHITNDLTFDQHIHTIAKRGRKIAGWILRVFNSRDRSLLVPLLKQLIHSTIEYCCILWSPTRQDLITIIEAIQKNFTSKIWFRDSTVKPDYWERLSTLKIYSLERRRERYHIIYVWKVIHNIYPNPGLLLNTALPIQHRDYPNRGIDINYNERTGLTVSHDSRNIPTIDRKSILSRCCRLYNSIPSHLRQLSQDDDPKLQSFKKDLDKWLATVPDQPTISQRQRAAPSNSILDQKNYRK